MGGNVEILLILCRLFFADDAMQTDIHKALAPFNVNSHRKCTFFGGNSQVYCDKLQDGLSADYFFTKKQIAMVFNKTTILSLFYLARFASIP